MTRLDLVAAARGIAWLHVLFGVAGTGISVLMSGFLLLNPRAAGGCCGGSFAPLFLMLFGVLAVVSLPQLVLAARYLRGRRHGASSMAILSALNLLSNASLTVAVASKGENPAWVFPFAAALAVNVAALLVYTRPAVREGLATE